MTCLPGVLLVALAVAPGVGADVLIVDPANPAGFEQLADAVDIAGDGDTILIQGPAASGTAYELAVVAGKSLTVVLDSAGPISTQGMEVRDLAAGQSVVLRGLPLGNTVSAGSGLRCLDNDGVVWVEGCTIAGGNAPSLPGCSAGPAGLEVVASASVVVARCLLIGGAGSSASGAPGSCQSGFPGGPGARVASSQLAVYESDVYGGSCGFGALFESQRGGPGVECSDASLLLSRVTAVGGIGGFGCDGSNEPLCAGGDGLLVDGASSVKHVQGVFVGGPGSPLPSGIGPDGAPWVVEPGAEWVDWPGSARSLSLSSPVREDSATTLRYVGKRGDVFGVFLAAGPGWSPLPGKQGVFTLGSPVFGPLLVATVTSLDGVFEASIPSGDLDVLGLEALNLSWQAFGIPLGGSAVLSSPGELTIVDDAF